MANGFVYVLLNVSFPDQVKIGLTEDATDARAKQLWSTGVPTPFIVIYDELVSDCAEVERRVHARFNAYRVHSRREFFRVPVREAIRALQEEAETFRISRSTPTEKIDVLPNLQRKYGQWLGSDLLSASIVQLTDVCFFETIRRPYPHARDEIVERVDLAVLAAGDGPMFPPDERPEENARRFVDELDAYDLIMTTNLFSPETAQEIATEWERPGGELDIRRAGQFPHR